MSRILTLENMDTVSLQGTFDYRALAGEPWEVFYIQQDRIRRKIQEGITLGDVYRLFGQGLQFHEVKDALHIGDRPLDREIENKTVLIGQAFYKAVNPGVKGFRRSNVVRALCDENIDEHNALDGAQRVFGYASHTTFENLTGQPDAQVWKKALSFDFIISKDRALKASRVLAEDRDLTNCSYDAWRDILERNGGVIDDEIRSLPILIHIKDAQASGREIKRMLQKYKTEILNLAEQHKSPVIILEKGRKPTIGIHYLDLIDGGTEKRRHDLINSRVKYVLNSVPFRLNSHEKEEFGSSVRKIVQKEVDALIKSKPQAEDRISALDDAIKNVQNNPFFSDDNKVYFKRLVLNARRVKKTQKITKLKVA